MPIFASFQPGLSLLAASPRAISIVPLAAACLAIVIGLSVAASKSRLHIPGYVGLAFGSFAVAMIVGHFSGSRNISGTPWGFALSIIFFLLIAVAVGAVLALFFYRHPLV